MDNDMQSAEIERYELDEICWMIQQVPVQPFRPLKLSPEMAEALARFEKWSLYCYLQQHKNRHFKLRLWAILKRKHNEHIRIH